MPRSATTPSIWKNISATRATSNSRCSATARARRSTSASATARSSAATRRCSRKPPRRSSRPSSAREMGAICRQGDGRHGLSRRRHDRVPLREWRILLHRDEHPAAGRASGDRDDQRHRPGARADPRRPGRRPVGARRTRSSSTATPSNAASTPRIRRPSRPRPALVKNYVAPGGMHVRVDSGLYAGYKVPPYYDSMIGKLIVYGTDPRTLHHAAQARARGIRGRGHEDHRSAPPADHPRPKNSSAATTRSSGSSAGSTRIRQRGSSWTGCLAASFAATGVLVATMPSYRDLPDRR